MAASRGHPFSFGSGLKSQGLATAAIVAALVLLAAVPLRRNRGGQPNPALEAATTSQLLLAKIGNPTGQPGPSGDAWTPRLQRDLFSPERHVEPALNTASGPRRPSLPKLSGVWIDGPTRQAVIGGRIVRRGDLVDDFRVVEVGPDGVVLERDGARYRLSIRRTP